MVYRLYADFESFSVKNLLYQLTCNLGARNSRRWCLYYSWPIIYIPGKSRDQNLRVALYKCMIVYNVETLVLSMLYDEEQITKVSRLYLMKFVFSDTIYF